MNFINSYDDAGYAAAYAELKFHGTYYLAYRDLPDLILEYAPGVKAIDFGCGTGRSTRFLTRLGFDTVGVDISQDMLKIAREADPAGDYRLVEEGNLGRLEENKFDLALSAFTFDNIPTMAGKTRLFSELERIIKKDGVIINLVSSPEMYTHEWVSFSTKDFPENERAKSGDVVKIIITDIKDNRPVEDILWRPEDYSRVFDRAGLDILCSCKPLARDEDPYEWVNETRIAPWTIYVLGKRG